MEKIKVSPQVWMGLFEQALTGVEVAIISAGVKAGDEIALVPYNWETKKELKGLPVLVRKINYIDIDIYNGKTQFYFFAELT